LKKFLFLALVLILAVFGCSRNKEPLTLRIEWQKADTDACLACKGGGAREADIQKAFERLSKQLAAKGIRVELVEKKATVDSTVPEIAGGQMWLGNLPVENWLGASTQGKICPACPVGKYGKGHMHKSLVLDGQVYDPIPVELMVRAGMNAAQQLVQNQKSETGKQK